MLRKLQVPAEESRATFSLLLGLVLIAMPVAGADLRLARPAPTQVSNAIPCNTMTAAEVLASRYPDPEALMAPARCKDQARQQVQKWRQQDLDDFQKLAAEACGETQAEWVLKRELSKLERQSVLAEMSCGCSAEILSQATNPPAPPSLLKVVTETEPASENAAQQAALIPVRYNSQVLAKKAAVVISHNAAELLSIISGKLNKGLSTEQFDSELSGQWNNQYKTALHGLVQATKNLQTLSVELAMAQTPRAARPQTTPALPEVVQTLIEQTHLLSQAYDGIVRERELPWGQCYEAFAIRHQLITNSVTPLVSKGATNPGTK